MTVATAHTGRFVGAAGVQPAGLNEALHTQLVVTVALQAGWCGFAGTMATSVQVLRSATAPPLHTTPSFVAA